ncbi:MAG: signal peptide peptidase SppA [Abitibacteriaceae bacterium]|nr:signal peptide peptidase SppA [Abditibacteriaceae bacterium]
MKRSASWPWILLSALILLIVGGMGLMFVAVVVSGSGVTGPHVGLIDLSGEITDQGVRSVISGSSRGARDFIESVEAAGKDDSIKAVVIRINSPGGSAAASQEMYQAVKRLKDKKPVVCSMGDVAASGGYYVASGCNKIYANGSTLTGSIGVISEYMNFQGLFKHYGVDQQVIKSGKFKDAGNFARPLTPEERQLSQAMIMNVYNQFVDDVVAGRSKAPNGKLTKAQVLKLADGRVYTGLQAKANKLVDDIGGLHDAVQEAGKMGGISGEPKVREVGGGGLLSGMIGATAQSTLARSIVPVAEQAGSAFADGYMQRMKAATKQPIQLQAR